MIHLDFFLIHALEILLLTNLLTYCRRRVVRHTAHIAVYQSLSVRAVASRYMPSTADVANSSSLSSVVIALEVENVNTVSCVSLWSPRL